MQHLQRFVLTCLLAALGLSGVGCSAASLGFGPDEPWERAYSGRNEQIVVERFEIDVRNASALSRVSDFYDPNRVVFPDGTALSVYNDLELLAVRPGLERAIRKTDAEQTIRRTTQRRYELNSQRGTEQKIELPDDARTRRMMFRPTDASGDGSPAAATSTHIVLELEGRFEEGWEMSLRPRAIFAGSDLGTVLKEFHFFLRPGEAVVLRTYANKPDELPGYLHFEHEGQRYETVYLLTYVRR
ncbi:hypothetical protein OT109_07570 [Phycisphaeraceae bacterium D3-23]